MVKSGTNLFVHPRSNHILQTRNVTYLMNVWQLCCNLKIMYSSLDVYDALAGPDFVIKHIFLKSAWRHSVYYYYDKARNTPYFASWHLGDSLGVYRWPQCRYKRRFYKSHNRLWKITLGNRCRNIRTMQNVTNKNLIDPNKSRKWG